MSRINLTLDTDTKRAIEHHAKEHDLSLAGAARQLLRDALARVETQRERRRLATDYAAGRADARKVLRVMEAGQLDLLDDE